MTGYKRSESGSRPQSSGKVSTAGVAIRHPHLYLGAVKKHSRQVRTPPAICRSQIANEQVMFR